MSERVALQYPRRWWWLGLAGLLLIAALSLLPLRAAALAIPNGDKLNHCVAYIVLMLYFGQLAGAHLRQRVSVIIGLIAYGVLIEASQSVMPPRTAEWADLAANLCGILIGLVLLRTPLGRLLIAVEQRF